MRKLVAFGLLLVLSFTQIANAMASSNEETFIMHSCDKCDNKDKKRSCCKKEKSCSKKEEKKKEEKKRSCCKKEKSCSKKKNK